MELCHVEPDHCVSDDTSRGWRWHWRTKLEDVEQVEQDKEQHGKQGEDENVGAER